MSKDLRPAEQQIADEAAAKSLHPVTSKEKIAESQATPEFEENHKRLRAERLAREATRKAKASK